MRWPRIPRRQRSQRTASADDADLADADDPQERARRRMVAEQLEAREIRDPELLRAFLTVPRHEFVEGDDPYGDHALPSGSGQTIPQPYVVARLTQAAHPPGPAGYRGAQVREVGAGSGYTA